LTHRALIVNADDFGRSAAINRGIMRANEFGIVTSASLMVRWADAEPAAELARGTDLSVGLHFDLGEWEFRDGEWRAVYEVLAAETPEAVERELASQLERFERLVGRAPTHLDSHQHVHREMPARRAVRRAGERLGVPVRHFTPEVTYSGAFFGQDGKGNPFPEAIKVEALVRVIEALPPGVTELACHPAAEAEGDSVYDAERVVEVDSLCDPRVREAIERGGIALRSFASLGRQPAA
jgi:chitin disaccharide deacetylase